VVKNNFIVVKINQRDIRYTEEEINEIVNNFQEGNITPKIQELVESYQEESGKYAMWRDKVTEGFKKWLKGEKIYTRDKERISLYVSENRKSRWLEFIKEHNINTISRLIRQSVQYYIEQHSKSIADKTPLNKKTLFNISHSLKEPLTAIKGFSQLLLEDYKDELKQDIIENIENIFEQSRTLESKIKNILEDFKEKTPEFDILLIEDDQATKTLLTSYFSNKGYKCNGVITGAKALEELRTNIPKIILLDIILPDISGYELCNRIKNDEKLKDIPIYLLTAIPGSEVEKKMDEIKADGYILKPFDFSDFKPIFKYLEEES
jgi:CheY-like chemotaxis protein